MVYDVAKVNMARKNLLPVMFFLGQAQGRCLQSRVHLVAGTDALGISRVALMSISIKSEATGDDNGATPTCRGFT